MVEALILAALLGIGFELARLVNAVREVGDRVGHLGENIGNGGLRIADAVDGHRNEIAHFMHEFDEGMAEIDREKRDGL